MKITATNQQVYNFQHPKTLYTPNFEGKNNFSSLTGNLLTKKNFSQATIGTFLITSLLKFFDVDIPDIAEKIPNILLGLTFCITENPNKLDENIEFKKARNLKEAKDFANEKLGIKNFKINDLYYANWINEGLTNISNKFNGNVYFPQNLKFNRINLLHESASYTVINDTISINKAEIEKIAGKLNSIVKKNSFEELTKYNLGKGYEKYCEKLKKAYENIEDLSIFEKYSLVTSTNRVKSRLKKIDLNAPQNLKFDGTNKYGNIYADEFDIIYHETGHCFDTKSNMLIEIFMDRIKYRKDLKKLNLPSYALSNTQEFIACIFSGIMQDEKYLPEVTNLFKKLIKFKIKI